MNDYVIEEMADAISTELRVPNEDVLRILHHYWQDKIAPIWASRSQRMTRSQS